MTDTEKRKLRRWAHDGVRDAERMLNIEVRSISPGMRHEIICAAQQMKLDVLTSLLEMLKDKIV